MDSCTGQRVSSTTMFFPNIRVSFRKARKDIRYLFLNRPSCRNCTTWASHLMRWWCHFAFLVMLPSKKCSKRNLACGGYTWYLQRTHHFHHRQHRCTPSILLLHWNRQCGVVLCCVLRITQLYTSLVRWQDLKTSRWAENFACKWKCSIHEIDRSKT